MESRDGELSPAKAPVGDLWRQSRRWLAAILYAHKPRDADLEDLMQDVAMKLVQHGHELGAQRDPASLRPWLRTVAINVARSAGRRMRTRGRAMPELEYHAARRAAESALPDRELDETPRGRGARALEITLTLPPADREALLLSLRGLTQRQIAEVLEVPITTVETRLIRARRMVREELEREAQPVIAATSEMNEVLS